MTAVHSWRQAIRWSAVAIAALATVIALTLSGFGSGTIAGRATPVTPEITDSVITLSPAELVEWRQRTATPRQRAEIIAQLNEAFAGVATVGDGASPQATGSTPSGARVQQVLATGFTGDHFWITASYADIARGAVPAAVAACAIRIPRALCSAAGNWLIGAAAGWGAGNSHGLWAAVYWWPPRFTGGRW
ncbi:hypothetical protein [Nakamurella sp.]|uniref:hypothetical protein n=1 Tax=Nakamurella sp. TaxID=1869182 RepID=UPI003784A704